MHNKDNNTVNNIIKSAATALGATGVAMLTACTFSPALNEEPAVYGPPPEDVDIVEPVEIDDEDIEPAKDPEQKKGQDTDIEYDPSLNEESEVYGPPEVFEDDEDPTFEPADNMPALIYGPPEMMEGDPINE